MLILLSGQTKDVRFQNVGFKFDTSLAAVVVTRHVSAEAIEGPDWEGPAPLSFALQGYYANSHTPPPYHKTPEFRVYRVRDFHKRLE